MAGDETNDVGTAHAGRRTPPAGLVLWDIDHTLVDGAGLGERIWGGAFERLTGVPVSRAFAPDGSTDPLIFRALVELHETPDGGWTSAEIEQAYHQAFLAVRDEWRERARAKVAAREAIAELASRGLVQSVLTGNVAANARGKLSALDLDAHLDFSVGAFGSDPHVVRGDLVAVARQRAVGVYSHEFGPSDTVLVGDTPLDIRAGHDGGARVVAVATGVFSTDELTAAGADRVLPDLTELAEAVRSLLS